MSEKETCAQELGEIHQLLLVNALRYCWPFFEELREFDGGKNTRPFLIEILKHLAANK